jgi:hypothetical protein
MNRAGFCTSDAAWEAHPYPGREEIHGSQVHVCRGIGRAPYARADRRREGG